jgi:alpha-methylacyl-CoA racemase
MQPDSWGDVPDRIATVLATRPAAEWVAELGPTGAAVGPVNTPADLLADPHVQARGGLVDVGGTMVPANPVRVRGVETPATRPAPPAVGADTRAVLSEAGYSDGEIDELLAEGAVSD